jgi:hypothetical protein
MRVLLRGIKGNQLSPKIDSKIAKLRSCSEKQKTDRIIANPSLGSAVRLWAC